jgi:hypothetical protein
MEQGSAASPRPDPGRAITLCGTKLDQPGHVCVFFDSADEQYAALGPFLREGIDVGDRVLNVVDAERREEHLRRLAGAGVPVERALAADQLRVLTAEETYLKDAPGRLDGMLELLRQEMAGARQEGRAVRTCGDMNWIARSRIPSEYVLEYEARVNAFVPTYECTLLCLYDLTEIDSGMLADILATHQLAVINGVVRRNDYYVQPDEYLKMLRARRKSS